MTGEAEAIAGLAQPRFRAVADAFAESFAGRPGMGAALCVYVDGEPVVDLWGGTADERTGEPWTEQTVGVVFSCTKGLMSILAARLVQEGLLDYDAPVCRYWPEFAAGGKSQVLVRHILSHQSGMSAPRTALSSADMRDWATVTGLLAAQEPLWEPGAGWAYHAITHGWLIGEVIRRITGLSAGEYFAETLAAPLGADAWIGLPEPELGRVAHLQVGSTLAALVAAQQAELQPGVVDWPHRAMTLGGALPPDLVTGEGGFNTAATQRAEIPGAGGIASARAMAAIWSSTVTPTRGIRVLDDATLDGALAPQTDGAPVFAGTAPFPRWAMGFQLDSGARRYLGGSSFGHDGAGGQVAFADREHGVGFAFITNQMEADDPRATAILAALRATLQQA